ncbi:MAG TPA: 50S ribosomal protein L11 methyltransferase [Pyrinomonadaceae bacterium]|nr:50S ribosomal protein L11 methyltransferase [Pyrinomonadaceae bacterium]
MTVINSNSEKHWFALNILVDSAASEAVEFALNELDALGTEINNLGKTPTATLTVIGYFNEKPDEDWLKSQLSEALRIYDFDDSAIKNVEWHEVENQDWLAEWKKTWKPTVTDKFIIAPMWETVENTDKIVVRIEPSMAFGTGTHETTRLCLRAIEDFYKGESVLDVGTGTGILAIAASKSQFSGFKSQVVGCDVDEDSIVIAKENAEVNETPEIEFYVGSIDESTPNFDFVFANLTADVIIPLLPLLVAKFNKTLVLSGILKEQEDSVLSELKKLGIENGQVKTDGEWISITVSNS